MIHPALDFLQLSRRKSRNNNPEHQRQIENISEIHCLNILFTFSWFFSVCTLIRCLILGCPTCVFEFQTLSLRNMFASGDGFWGLESAIQVQPECGQIVFNVESEVMRAWVLKPLSGQERLQNLCAPTLTANQSWSGIYDAQSCVQHVVWMLYRSYMSQVCFGWFDSPPTSRGGNGEFWRLTSGDKGKHSSKKPSGKPKKNQGTNWKNKEQQWTKKKQHS